MLDFRDITNQETINLIPTDMNQLFEIRVSEKKI